MRIGELAAQTGVRPKTIRFYETAGVLPAPARTTSGYRVYDSSAVDRLAFVKAAQAAGLTLAQVRDVISAREASGAPCQHVAAMLENHATALQARITALSDLLEHVRRLSQRATTLDPGQCLPQHVCHAIPTSQLTDRSSSS
ncbi:heavy metal-responsive transcriptional regulator [Georgenia sp. Z1491]|uniref:heavy metal-responsive transcriptional regulator n=1 Tax=Georgenia sp. Z1491 TaxID=3416707 RepID=UPI003CF86542